MRRRRGCARQRYRVRFTTAAALVTELVEAKQQLGLQRVLARWARYDVVASDEVGYVPLAELGAEFLFQVIAERAENAAVLLTTNLPFSEWTQVIPNARLCKALLDRITDRAHIIETGTESYRFRRTLAQRAHGHGAPRTPGQRSQPTPRETQRGPLAQRQPALPAQRTPPQETPDAD